MPIPDDATNMKGETVKLSLTSGSFDFSQDVSKEDAVQLVKTLLSTGKPTFIPRAVAPPPSPPVETIKPIEPLPDFMPTESATKPAEAANYIHGRRIRPSTLMRYTEGVRDIMAGKHHMKMSTLSNMLATRIGRKSGLSGDELAIMKKAARQLGYVIVKSNYRYNPLMLTKPSSSKPASPVIRSKKKAYPIYEQIFDNVMRVKDVATFEDFTAERKKLNGLAIGGFVYKKIREIAERRGYIIEGKRPIVIKKPPAFKSAEPTKKPSKGRMGRPPTTLKRVTQAFHDIMDGNKSPMKLSALLDAVANNLGRKVSTYGRGLSGSDAKIVHELIKQLGYKTERHHDEHGAPTYVLPTPSVVVSKPKEPAQKPSLKVQDDSTDGDMFKKVKSLVFSRSYALKDKFGVPDVIRALGLAYETDYGKVWLSLDSMCKTGGLKKFSYLLNGKRRVFFSIKKKGEFSEAVQKVVLPSDTNIEVLKRIFNSFDTFTWEALRQVRNKHGNCFDKWSAKGLIKWIATNKEYAEELVGKRLNVGGQGDYLFIQVFDKSF